MTSVRCPACTLPNLEGSTTCRRCGTSLVSDGTASAWRDGSELVLRSGGTLPDRCVRCGGPARGSGLQQTFYWHHPTLYLLAFCALLVYALVAIAVRKKVTLFVPLCEQHRRRRQKAMWGSALVAILGVVSLLVAIEGGALFGWGGLAMILGGAVWGSIEGRSLSAKRIDDHFSRFKGACPEFLAPLNSWNSFSG